MIRAVQLVLAGSVIAVAALALVGMSRQPEAGMVGENAGGRVAHVEPGSPVWRSGVRAGDRILSLVPSDASSGWTLVTTNGEGRTRVDAARFTADHQANAPWAVVGALVALVSAMAAYRGSAVSAVLLPVAFGVAAHPLFFAGSLVATLVGGVAVFGGGGSAGYAFLSGQSRGSRSVDRVLLALAITGLGLSLAWVTAIIERI